MLKRDWRTIGYGLAFITVTSILECKRNNKMDITQPVIKENDSLSFQQDTKNLNFYKEKKTRLEII